MYFEGKFRSVTTVDTYTTVYKNFKDKLLSVDWLSIKPIDHVLSYSNNIICRIPWSAQNFGLFNGYELDQNLSIRDSFLSFIEYIEHIVPGHKVVRADANHSLPEKIDRYAELARMHYDGKIFHRYCRRCQLGIQVNEGSRLFVEGESILINELELCEFNNKLCHWGVNWGSTSKIILILDLIDINTFNKLGYFTKKSMGEYDPNQIEFNNALRYLDIFKKQYNLSDAITFADHVG